MSSMNQQLLLEGQQPKGPAPELLANLALANKALWVLWEPPPDLSVSEWAEKNRILPKGTTARPGLYVAEKFQSYIMNAVCDPVVRRVSCMKSTQVGWTELLLNIVGYYIGDDTGTISLTGEILDDSLNHASQPFYRTIER